MGARGVRLFGVAAVLSAAASRTTPAPVSRAAIVISWPQTAITTPEVDRALVEFVATRHFGYHALDDAQRRRLGADLARSRLGSVTTLDQAVCVRNLLYKLQLDTQRAALSPHRMAEHYAADARGSIAASAAHFQTAPLEVARAVVRHRYCINGSLLRRVLQLTVSFVGERSESAASAPQLAAFRAHLLAAASERRLSAQAKRDLARFSRELSPADWLQIVWACEHDMQGVPKEVTYNGAQAGEAQLERHLARCGASFRTEQDLRLEQDEERRSTPDILFDEAFPVCLGPAQPSGTHGDRVCWLDMKNQYGTVSCGPASDALVEQLAGKAARYTADWGPGAFVLKYGFCSGLCRALREQLGSSAHLVTILSADSLPAASAPTFDAPNSRGDDDLDAAPWLGHDRASRSKW